MQYLLLPLLRFCIAVRDLLDWRYPPLSCACAAAVAIAFYCNMLLSAAAAVMVRARWRRSARESNDRPCVGGAAVARAIHGAIA